MGLGREHNAVWKVKKIEFNMANVAYTVMKFII